MKNRIIIPNVNKLPVPTWRWLKLNGSTFSCENTNIYTDIKPQILNLSDKIKIENRSPEKFPHIKTGIGNQAEKFIKTHAAALKTITIKENSRIDEPAYFIYDLNNDNFFVSSDYVHAGKNSRATLIFVYDSPHAAQGFHAGGLKILAEENAEINIIQIQTLGRDFINFDDIGIYSEANAKICVKQIALGGKNNWLGINADLVRDHTELNLKLDYITAKNQNLDINYVANIYGRKNSVQITANGILMRNAQKIMRGTLDFKQGCKGSIGNETENVLLLDEDVQNKSIPLILCNEEDIQGNHAASIGEMDEAQLFYLYTRGLDEVQIRQMQIDSRIQLICNELPEELHSYILNYQKEAF